MSRLFLPIICLGVLFQTTPSHAQLMIDPYPLKETRETPVKNSDTAFDPTLNTAAPPSDIAVSTTANAPDAEIASHPLNIAPPLFKYKKHDTVFLSERIKFEGGNRLSDKQDAPVAAQVRFDNIEQIAEPLNLSEQIALAKQTMSADNPVYGDTIVVSDAPVIATVLVDSDIDYSDNGDIAVRMIVDDMEDALSPSETITFGESDVAVIDVSNITVEPVRYIEQENTGNPAAPDVEKETLSEPVISSLQQEEAIAKETVTPKATTTWQAFRGARLQDVFTTWAASGDYMIIWDAVENFKVPDNIVVTGTVEDAVSGVLQQFNTQYTRPVANLHIAPDGRKTLVVLSHSGA